MTLATLTRDDDGLTYSCGDYLLYRCSRELPDGCWILRFDGELVGYPRTVEDARRMLAARIPNHR